MLNIIIGLGLIILYSIIINKKKSIAIGLLVVSLAYNFKISISNINIYIFDLFYVSLLVSKLFSCMMEKKYKIANYEGKLVKWVIIYFYWTLMAFLVGVIFLNNTGASISNFISLVRYIQIISIFILVISYNLKFHEIRIVFRFMYWNAIIVAIYGIIQTRQISSIAYDLQVWFGRTYSVFNTTGPNALAVYLSFFILATVGFIIDEQTRLKQRIFLFLAAIIFAYPFIYTSSRTGYVALFISIAFLIFIKRKILLPLYLLIIVVIASNGVVYDRLITYTLSNGLDVSSMGRLEYWRAAIQTIIHYPISGVGFNGFSILGLDYTSFFDSLINVHNQYLQTMLNSGIVGFFIFSVLIVSLYKIVFKIKRGTSDYFIRNITSIHLSSIVLLGIGSFFFSPFLNFQVIGQFWVASALVIKLKEEDNFEDSNGHNL